MKVQLLTLIFPLLFLFACGEKGKDNSEATFSISNPTNIPQESVIRIDANKLRTHFPSLNLKKVKFSSDADVPFQANDTNGDGKTDEFLLQVNMDANTEKEVRIQTLAAGEKVPEFTKRTQAEISHKVNGHWEGREYIDGEFKNVDFLRVPPEHTDHSWFIRYEGPGWESDKVGYRFYLDWRNATDIFGKKTAEMALQDVGQDGFDSYHEPAAWGMDILKVGRSLGIGALGFWQGDSAMRVEKTDSIICEITRNGILESQVQTQYFGWQAGEIKTDVTSDLSIQAGSRMTRHDIILSNALPNLCTGIVKHEEAELFQKEYGDWGYIATWGKQSLAEGNLGMALLYRTSDKQQITEDKFSHVIVLTPQNQKLTYYFLAAWEQEQNGITTLDMFNRYLDNLLLTLGQPPQVNIPE